MVSKTIKYVALGAVAGGAVLGISSLVLSHPWVALGVGLVGGGIFGYIAAKA